MPHSKEQLTGWYPPHIKPVRVGVYETRLPGWNEVWGGSSFKCFKHWDGEFWGYASETIDEAQIYADQQSISQHNYWRGLKTEIGE